MKQAPVVEDDAYSIASRNYDASSPVGHHNTPRLHVSLKVSQNIPKGPTELKD